MGFFNLFKKKNVSREIVNPRDELVLPSKESLTSEELDLLSKYKKDYLNKLKGNVLSSLDLEIDTLSKDFDMYTSLISNVVMDVPKNGFYNEEEITEEKSKIDLIVKSRKLIIYLNDI